MSPSAGAIWAGSPGKSRFGCRRALLAGHAHARRLRPHPASTRAAPSGADIALALAGIALALEAPLPLRAHALSVCTEAGATRGTWTAWPAVSTRSVVKQPERVLDGGSGWARRGDPAQHAGRQLALAAVAASWPACPQSQARPSALRA